MLSWAPSLAQTDTISPGERRYFPQTGHSVSGEFLRAYSSVADPILIYGYPITEAYEEQLKNRLVQYFERARFELSHDNPQELGVHVSELGLLMETKGTELAVPANFPACSSFPGLKFVVCYAFRDFFDAQGGAAVFGYPISNFQIVDQHIVQYFQRARFEWRPELPAGKRVALTPLGRQYFYKLGEDPAHLLPAPLSAGTSNIPQSIYNLHVRAFPNAAVTPQQSEQTIHIVVQDQNLQAISNAEVALVILLPSGQERRIIIPEFTDKNGVVQFTFDFDGQPIGVATIQVTASFDTLSAKTSTSFRVWY